MDSERIQQLARELLNRIETVWYDYDFSEEETDPERRVPQLKLSNNQGVEGIATEVRIDAKQGISTAYVRTYDVKYENFPFRICVVASLEKGKVRGFYLYVDSLENNTAHTLISERL